MIVTLIVSWLLVGLIGARIQYNWAHADNVRLDKLYPTHAESAVTEYRTSDIRLSLLIGLLFGPLAVLIGLALWIVDNPRNRNSDRT